MMTERIHVNHLWVTDYNATLAHYIMSRKYQQFEYMYVPRVFSIMIEYNCFSSGCYSVCNNDNFNVFTDKGKLNGRK